MTHEKLDSWGTLLDRTSTPVLFGGVVLSGHSLAVGFSLFAAGSVMALAGMWFYALAGVARRQQEGRGR